MRPYTEVTSPDLPDSVSRYDLFAVVTHEGKLDNGHYWADVLSSGEWWHCDDDKGMSTRVPRIKVAGPIDVERRADEK
jgi:ubiquitin carboxyl-terminal hydrolase 22/27/51